MIAVRTSAHDFHQQGALLHAGLAQSLLPSLNQALSAWPDGNAGVRISDDAALAGLLSAEHAVGRRVVDLLGSLARPVRAVLFDKNDNADWSLGWHQDRTVAVRRRKEAKGFGPWSIKQGIIHVEPPFAVIEAMITVRIHLDPVDRDNAPLLIAPGSHRFGRVAVSQVDDVVVGCGVEACLADTGDVWFYHTPILHASEAARGGPRRRRRVLQVDYAAADLPAGLEWLGI